MSLKIQLSKETESKIIYLYTAQNMSMRKISQEIKLSQRVIQRVLKEHNIEIRTNQVYRRKQVDENYFNKIDTEEKAYILGFIYADGCVTNHHLRFKVALKDIEILEKIKAALKSEHDIGVYVNNNGYAKGNKYCSLSMKNYQIEKDLAMLGVYPRKTKTLLFPIYNQVPIELIRHFIRGFFDGDGSVYKSSSPVVSFTGTYDMLLGVQRELSKLTQSKAQIYPYKNKDVFDYKIGGKNNLIKIYDYFYKDATIFLGRKKYKFEESLR